MDENWVQSLTLETQVTVQDIRPGDYEGDRTSAPFDYQVADYAVRGCPKQV